MRILLNVIKRENFVFFDPINKVHLNRVTPFGNADILSSSLKRAILAGNVIDVDNGFNVEISNKVKNINEGLLQSLKIKPKTKEIIKENDIEEEVLIEKVDIEIPKEEVKEEVIEEVKEEKKRKSRSKVAK